MSTSAPTPIVNRANGFCVTLRMGTWGNYAYQHYYTDDWYDALATYEEPPSGCTATGISACEDGVPVSKLTAHQIADLRADTPRAA